MTTYLVTGASSGIGLEIARQLAEAEHKVLALARSTDRLVALSRQYETITPVTFDISTLEDIDPFAKKIIAEHPDLSVLINNAGIQENVRLDDASYGDDAIAREITVNLTAPVALCRAFLPHLKAQDAGHIVNVTSGLAFVPKLTAAVYSASKSGLHLFTDALRVQMQDHPLTISEAILPIVDTPMTAGRGTGKISAAEAARQIIDGMKARQDHIYVGKTKWMPFLLRFAPFIARRAVQKP